MGARVPELGSEQAAPPKADAKPNSGLSAAAFWKAVATVPLERRRAIGEIEAFFGAGTVPEGLDGPYRGRLVTTTVGYSLDLLAEALNRVWMPWRGKTFDPSAGGRNVFSARGRIVERLLWPHYRDIRDHGPGMLTAFRFWTSRGQSATHESLPVLRLDYDLPENPSWPVRHLLEELVQEDEGLFLGQALLRAGERWRRAAWFLLEPSGPIPAKGARLP